MSDDEIVSGWISQYYKEYKTQHPSVSKLTKKLKESSNIVRIWLGGPGKDTPLYHFRELVKQMLEKENFKVDFSEDYGGGPDIASKEIQEVITADLVLLMAVSPGSSSECIEFSYLEKIRPKMRIFFPKDFQSGYVYRSLNERHKQIDNESDFSFDGMKNFDSELPVKILARAIAHRNEQVGLGNLMVGIGTNP